MRRAAGLRVVLLLFGGQHSFRVSLLARSPGALLDGCTLQYRVLLQRLGRKDNSGVAESLSLTHV